ncbi:transglycosylase SLT domain-containing protein [Alicyclobacillus sendaiensis]|uniref:transglycosylase SLT domain-containing protein n=1 Tax=Alicyclobacillus sendaiensis TaxID=192387 RepID=UPI00078082F9|nr:transglycosylase SLT domain-containing protein [Alicyclobacillus sendaiensis]
MEALVVKLGLRIGLRMAQKRWPLLLVFVFFLFVAPFLGGLLLVLAIIGGANALNTAVPESWNGQIPKDVSPANGIPQAFVAYVQQASETYQVPMQYLAATALHESAWEPNAYADYAGSHAMGLMQFEPETWSGWSDPYTRVDEPDTDALRIEQYGGYGVDADGLWAPIGTPSRVALNPVELAQLNAACAANQDQGCAPYASPWDPDDALSAGAKYLHMLYLMYGNWPNASAHYYGSSDKAAVQDYINALMRMTAAYILDTPPVALPDGGYWPFGDAKLTFTISSGGWTMQATSNDDNTPLVSEFLPSLPIIAPTSGTVTWTTSGSQTTITLPLPNGSTLALQFASRQGMKWALAQNQTKGTVAAGDIVGFLNVTQPVRVSNTISTLFPSGFSGGTVAPPGQPVHTGG